MDKVELRMCDYWPRAAQQPVAAEAAQRSSYHTRIAVRGPAERQR